MDISQDGVVETAGCCRRPKSFVRGGIINEQVAHPAEGCLCSMDAKVSMLYSTVTSLTSFQKTGFSSGALVFNELWFSEKGTLEVFIQLLR